MKRSYFQPSFFRPTRCLWRLAPGPETGPTPAAERPQKKPEKPQESTQDKMKKFKAQFEAEQEAFRRVDALLESKKEEIKAFIEARSEEGLKYRPGDWEQWNKDFLEAIDNPDPKEMNIKLIQEVLFRKLKLKKDPQAQQELGYGESITSQSMDGKVGPYTLVALSVYLGQELPKFTFRNYQKDTLPQSTLDPLAIGEKGEVQPALTTVIQQYEAEKEFKRQETEPSAQEKNNEYKVKAAVMEFDKNDIKVFAEKIKARREEALGKIPSIKKETEAEKVGWEEFATPFMEMFNEEIFESRALNQAVKEYRKAYKELQKADKANHGFLEAEGQKELAYENLKKAVSVYYDLQQSANDQAFRDYELRLKAVAKPYTFPAEAGLEAFTSFEAFNQSPLAQELNQKTPRMELFDLRLNKEGELPLHPITTISELEKYMKGADEKEQKVVAEKLLKTLEEKGYDPLKAINNRIYLNNLKRFSKQHENLVGDVLTQRQAAIDHIRGLTLDQLLDRESIHV